MMAIGKDWFLIACSRLSASITLPLPPHDGWFAFARVLTHMIKLLSIVDAVTAIFIQD